MTIRAHFGLERNPFDEENPDLLPRQKEIFDTLLVHSRQGGLCLVMGEPGTGKSVLKRALARHDPKRMLVPVVSRTLHTYPNTLQILCEAFGIEVRAQTPRREKMLIEAAWKANRNRKMLVPVIDDAHLMEIECLRRLRLLLEDFPKCHNLVLAAQNPLLDKLRLGANEDIRSRVTYSVSMPRLAPEDVQAFIFAQFDRAGLAHSAFSDEALDLAVRSSEGILRRARNLCVSAMYQAFHDRVRAVGLDQINTVLKQPHWRKDNDIPAG